MATTAIANLWTPARWIQGVSEGMANFPIIMNSGAVRQHAKAQDLADGGGITGNLPFFKDITDQADAPQVEATAPTKQNITSGLCVAPILNRECANSSEALASAVSGADPVAEMTAAIAVRRLKQRQATFIALLRGAFASNATIGGASHIGAALAATRISLASETGASPTSEKLISADAIINGKSLMGELQGLLRGGAIFMHSTIKAALEKADASSFKNGVQSGLPFTIETYKEMPLFLCDLLVRGGGVSGSVFDTYILSAGTLGKGEKAQEGDTIGVASLQFEQNKDTNNETIYDRTRFVLHIDGMKWIGSPAGQSASNAELATSSNWSLQYSSANRVGAVCIQTNG